MPEKMNVFVGAVKILLMLAAMSIQNNGILRLLGFRVSHSPQTRRLKGNLSNHDTQTFAADFGYRKPTNRGIDVEALSQVAYVSI